MNTSTRVMGIDTGIAIVGWSIVEKNPQFANKPKLIDYGAIITDSKLPTNERLAIIYKELTEKIEAFNPHIIAVESLFYFKNQKTVINVSQARGVILLAAEHAGRPTYDYTPLQVKTAVTGYGRADKEQIQKMVKLIYGLKEVPKPDDVADAIAVATCHINSH
ncbi:crossover junction endodeoxyribonuclease RuvC [Candidatus Dojkabacteria bacterium]|uniref:Crossover junction endodeoxyribonuclease RuvC n=1 Tax=Candidatus Dojkabacteria bacterium TaxID=2099670 RepID=A0A955LAA0_9BACT|nr:crossover junction endodeoxyribonuclease RuvC [Candidatus Dojkabacteria bacterium]